jgi:hypothetical protein
MMQRLGSGVGDQVGGNSALGVLLGMYIVFYTIHLFKSESTCP